MSAFHAAARTLGPLAHMRPQIHNAFAAVGTIQCHGRLLADFWQNINPYFLCHHQVA
jgi:hypothetical protein